MKIPFLSVIITTKDRQKYLVLALKSVCAQSFKDYELIVVDDGSAKPIIDEYKINMTIIRNSLSKGVSAARNAAIKIAAGEFVAFLDDDDMWTVEYLETQTRFLSNNPHIDVISARCSVIDQNGETMPSMLKPSRVPEWNLISLITGSSPVTSGTIIRRSALLKAGLFDETLKGDEDIDLYARLSMFAHFFFNDQILVNYRKHGANWTSGFIRSLEGHLHVCQKLMRLYPNYGNNSILVTYCARKHYQLARYYFEDKKMIQVFKHVLTSIKFDPTAGLNLLINKFFRGISYANRV